jgi:hypothetical protein
MKRQHWVSSPFPRFLLLAPRTSFAFLLDLSLLKGNERGFAPRAEAGWGYSGLDLSNRLWSSAHANGLSPRDTLELYRAHLQNILQVFCSKRWIVCPCLR